MSALEIIDQVPEFARLVALEINRIQTPQEDMISQNEAWKIYGRAWIKRYLDRGQLHITFHGNKMMYSKAEIERVKAKENAAIKLVIK